MKRFPLPAVALMAALYSALFTFLTFRRYDSFGTWAFDMGNMDQAVWSTLHGRILAFTNMEGVTTRLAIHCEPLLILISPLYLLWSDPRALLLLQTLALASGAFPLFWIARRELKSGWAAVAVAAFYLLFPSLEAVNLAEFHAVALSAPLLLWAFYFAEGDHWVAFAILSLLAAGTKEEVGLVVAMMGLYLAVSHRSRAALAVAAMGAVWSLVSVLFVIPHFNPMQQSPYTGYYEGLGDGMDEVVLGLATHPWIPIQRALEERNYIISLLMPGGWLAILSPERLAIGLSSLLINLLSANGEMQRPNLYHYTAPMIPAIALATVGGMRRLAAGLRRVGLSSGPAIALAVMILLAGTLLYHRDQGFTPLSKTFQVDVVTPHDLAAQPFLEMVPDGASLSVHPDLDSHLSQREKIYVFPRVEDAEYVLMDRLRDRSSRDVLTVPTEQHRERLKALDGLIASGEWDVLADRDGYVLLKRRQIGT